MKLIIFALLAAMILVSGCVSTDTISEGTGETTQPTETIPEVNDISELDTADLDNVGSDLDNLNW